MATNLISLSCPKCSEEFPLDEALSAQVMGAFQKDLDEASRKKEEEIKQKEASLLAMQEKLKGDAESLDKKVAEQLALEKERLLSELKIQAQSDVTAEMTVLKEQLSSKNEKLKEIQEEHVNILREKAALEESRQQLELDMQRRLEQERAQIKEGAVKDYQEKYHWELQQKEKTISDLNKKVEEMAQKITQGSQQSQGEVVELELESMLRTLCPLDDIEPVGKGINGADIVQTVRNRNGQTCGKIIWESKNTKAWKQDWIAKVKDDQRREKAEFAVIVSGILPESIKTFAQHENVWVTKFDCVAGLVMALRSSLVDVCAVKVQGENSQEKMQVLYNYVSGVAFRQRVEAIAETFSSMQSDLLKEKNVYQKIWAKRESQIQRVITNTFGMYGDFQGLIGPALQEITAMSLEPGEELEEISA